MQVSATFSFHYLFEKELTHNILACLFKKEDKVDLNHFTLSSWSCNELVSEIEILPVLYSNHAIFVFWNSILSSNNFWRFHPVEVFFDKLGWFNCLISFHSNKISLGSEKNMYFSKISYRHGSPNYKLLKAKLIIEISSWLIGHVA